MGNSLSAIFDALLNQLMAKGLNALSSKSNTPGSDDDFNYYGNTLNATTTGTSNTFDWNQVKDPKDDIDKLEYDGTKFIDKKILTEPTTIYCPAGQTGVPPNCVAATPVNCDTADGVLRPIPECDPVVN
jgi:hypothetical protein